MDIIRSITDVQFVGCHGYRDRSPWLCVATRDYAVLVHYDSMQPAPVILPWGQIYVFLRFLFDAALLGMPDRLPLHYCCIVYSKMLLAACLIRLLARPSGYSTVSHQ